MVSAVEKLKLCCAYVAVDPADAPEATVHEAPVKVTAVYGEAAADSVKSASAEDS